MKQFFIFIFLIKYSIYLFGQQASICGKVVDRFTEEELVFTSVKLFKNKLLLDSTTTDFDGQYCFNDLRVGTYEVLLSDIHLEDSTFKNIVLKEHEKLELNLMLPKPCPNDKNQGKCTYCSKSDSVISVIDPHRTIIDLFFKDDNEEVKFYSDAKKRGFVTMTLDVNEELIIIYIEGEKEKFGSPCSKWFCKSCKRIF